jgi:hypothetical protein
VLFAVGPGADAQVVLRAAMRAGQVEHFGFESAGLLELYRQLVAT